MITYMDNAEYRNISKSVDITYGSFSSPFGTCNIAIITKPENLNGNICFLSFSEPKDTNLYLEKHFKNAAIKQDNDSIKEFSSRIFSSIEELPLFLKGTEFQIRVWKILKSTKTKQKLSYEEVAKLVKKPTAYRAAANAIGSNPISYLIPCHRILRKDKSLGGYRWGIKIKQEILEYESKL